jgi:hypothetical protein
MTARMRVMLVADAVGGVWDFALSDGAGVTYAPAPRPPS